MIQFNCHCSYHFEVPEDQAGGLIQCPRCHRLCDIPTLSDVANLEDGGIYKIETVPEHPHQSFEEAHRVYTREHVDETTGEEIDLRPSADEIISSGMTAIPLADEVTPPPKYDPETGELIEPLDIKKEKKRVVHVDASKIPMARRALSYATAGAERVVDAKEVPRELLRPMNLMVMAIVAISHVFAALGNLLLIMPAMLTGIRPSFMNPILALILAHYANVVDEIGTEKRDELPRPLRNLSFWDDTFGPFFRTIVSIMVCYFPIIFWRTWGIDLGLLDDPTLTVLWFSGTLIFPAVWLTMLTSGTSLNLRPDRVIGVITAVGPRYLWISVLWLVVSTITIWAVLGPGYIPVSYLGFAAKFLAGIPFSAFIILPFSIYGMHLVTWELGLIYRVHHNLFPWVMQRHISTRKDTAKILEARHREEMRKKQLEKNRPDREARLNELRNPPPPPTTSRR
jgi:hypothetical protein